MQNNAQEQLRKTLTDLLSTLREIENVGKKAAPEKEDGSKYDKREPDAMEKVQRAAEAAAKEGGIPFILYTGTPDHKQTILQVNRCQHILTAMVCDLLCHENPDIQGAAKRGVLKAMEIQTNGLFS